MRRIKTILTKNAKFEIMTEIENRTEFIQNNRKLRAFIDCIDGNNVYEFKCVSNIEFQHYLQLAIYQYFTKQNSMIIMIHN